MFSCKKCGACCKGWTIPLFLPDLDRLIKILGPEKLFLNTCLSEGGYATFLLEEDGSCPFLRLNKCSIYRNRPLICRAFPFIASKAGKEICKGTGSPSRDMIKAGKDLRKEKSLARLLGRHYYGRFFTGLGDVQVDPKVAAEWMKKVERMQEILKPSALIKL